MITFEKFIHSDTAKARKIDNKPTDKKIIDNINKSIKFLNSLDVDDLYITSGYRCVELNKIVGGVNTSHHLQGWAADVSSSDINKLLKILKGKLDMIDQLIYYPKRNFIHVSVHPGNRKQYFMK